MARESLQQVIAPKERRFARAALSLAAPLLTHELFTSWPKPQSPLRRHRGGVRNSDPNPKSSHSARRRRTRRARHRPDGDRQDRVLRAADADAARTRTRQSAHATLVDPRADARARSPNSRAFRDPKQEPQADDRASHRRRLV